MFLDNYNTFISPVSNIQLTSVTYSFLQNAICLPYRYITDTLITDFKVDGKWVGTIQKGEKTLITRAKRSWDNMMNRCKAEGAAQKRNPSYVGCAASENFKNFQWFAEWCQTQIGYGVEGYQLDKDILRKGNKIYSEDTCVFVSQDINLLLNSGRKKHSGLPIGVSFFKGEYIAKCCDGSGQSNHIGCYNTPRKAFNAYKRVKERLIKQKANFYKSHIDPRVYETLMNHRFQITD